MNTKLFILLAATLLISLASFSISSRKKSNDLKSVYSHTVEVVSSSHIEGDDPKNASPVDVEKPHKIQGGRSHSEEDGKHHHFHFHRLTHYGRRRMIVLWIAKLILAISHASVLIYLFMHSIH